MNARRAVQSCTSCGRVLRRRDDIGNTLAPCPCGGVVIDGRSYEARKRERDEREIADRRREQQRVVIGARPVVVVDVDAILRAQTDAVRPRLPEVKRGR